MLNATGTARPGVGPWCEALLEDFERCWHAGPPPAPADFAARAPAGRRRALLAELVKIDLEQRWRCTGRDGGAPHLEDYLRRYPELAGPEGLAPLDLVVEEYRVRQWWGDRPGHAEYRRRFAAHEGQLDTVLGQADAALAAEGRPAGAGLEDFEVLEELGRGAAGVVYKARQRSLGRLVALKVLRADDRRQSERLRAEAQVTARLVHPNIVRLHAAGKAQGRPYLCLEYVAGSTLARRRAPRRPCRRPRRGPGPRRPLRPRARGGPLRPQAGQRPALKRHDHG